MNSSPSIFPQTESLSVLSLYEDKLKFYFVQNGAGDEESEAIKFAREVVFFIDCIFANTTE